MTDQRYGQSLHSRAAAQQGEINLSSEETRSTGHNHNRLPLGHCPQPGLDDSQAISACQMDHRYRPVGHRRLGICPSDRRPLSRGQALQQASQATCRSRPGCLS